MSKIRIMTYPLAVLSVLLLSAGLPARAAQPALTAHQAEFFEKNVRPILVDACYKCHSAKAEKLKGGLYLDTKAGALKGGKTGPAVVPGDLDKSLLIKAVRYTDEDLQMPPKHPLADAQVALLEAWVKMGAPDPRTDGGPPATSGAMTTLSLADAKNFWSFKNPVLPAIPAVSGNWAKSPIDALILTKMRQHGLEPAPMADKRTLIRRATFDLTGLPPTMDEVEAFEADHSSDAFEKVIDRLLASPAYGERWARHWMDLARYADTKGYVFQEERRYPFAYTYRNWVVAALNADMPYDQFLINQIAADRVLAGGKGAGVGHQGSGGQASGALNPTANLAAMGFLTLGRRFLNNQADIIDDRIDVVMRGTLALTVGCARCHDHKFDPIPTADYYSLYGVFASSSEPKDLPLLTTDRKSPQTIAYEKELAAKEADIIKFKHDRLEKVITPLKSARGIAAYMMAAGKMRGDNDRPDPALNRFAARRWHQFLERTQRGHDAIFAPWHAFVALPEKDFAEKAAATLKSFASSAKPTNASLLEALGAKPLKSLNDVAAAYGAFLEKEINNPKSAIATAADFPTNVTLANVESIFSGEDRSAYNNLLQKRDAVTATHPGAPARAMVMMDANPVTPAIFKRGNPAMRGASVPRQFLAVLSGDHRKPFTDGSGRLELARAIASKDNPLTARVFVNRVWMEHFGKALVRTPSDFGIRGEPPTHPLVLDDLAVRFMNGGWSIKKLHKMIMLSAAYQQSSVASEKALRDDSENRLLSHQNRQRLDYEAMRDSLLFAAGDLDRTIGGRSVDILSRPYSHRRTLYAFVDRQNLPATFRAFDFASPDQHAPKRFDNTVPQQALFMMNSPFVAEQARGLAKRAANVSDPAGKIRRLYRIALARDPSPEEIAMGLEYARGEASSPGAPIGKGSSSDGAKSRRHAPAHETPLTPWEKYAQVLLETNEFVFVD